METTQQSEFVFRRLADALRLGGRAVSPLAWLAVLVPVLVLGLLYVGWMYRREAPTIGRRWAVLLGVLRAAVYVALAVMFLLPADQIWDTTEGRSKVVVLADVSGSMATKDDSPTDATPVERLPTRQDKVIRFLTDDQLSFLKRLEAQNPVTVYRFGGALDDQPRQFAAGEAWPPERWGEWLKPAPPREPSAAASDEEKARLRKRQDLEALLAGGTNLGEALAAVLGREAGNMLQGVVVLSDGRNTQSSPQAAEDWHARAERAKVPVFTVAVGEDRPPIAIRIADVQAPDEARPDDRFPVRVEVDGEGLAGAPVEVLLDVTKPTGEKLTLKPKLGPGEALTFKPGEPPHARAEFDVDKPTDEGAWRFVARVPRDRREIFSGREHASEPVTVNVVKRKLRVLLFAGGPTRDYQFTRALFVRETDRRRAELSICLQSARPEVVQDVPAERMLRHFPDELTSPDDPKLTAETRPYNLGGYDLVIAFDPDWTQLTDSQAALLERWVGTQGGGLVVVGGPVNTYQLARGVNAERLKPVLDLYPIVPEDSRLQGLGVERPAGDAWPLNFTTAAAGADFLRLDEESKDPLAGWDEFFAGRKPGGAAEPGLRRGFYDYYPAKSVKSNANVIATFTDPRARTSEGKEEPYLVTMPYGNGRVVYLASGETWRLRQFREAYFERFWTKMARDAGSGTLASDSGRRGKIYMGKTFPANTYVTIPARLFGPDLRPLPNTERPKARVKPPPGAASVPPIEMRPRAGAGDAGGWFEGRFLATTPGNYEVEIDVPGGEALTRKFVVKETNPELDNTRPDFAQLRRTATDAAPVLARVDDQAKARLRAELERTNKTLPREPGEDRAGLRLYFDLKGAALIPECMVAERKTQRSRGPVHDLWDEGPVVRAGDPPRKLSLALLLVVGLLCTEWLIRKLLKLA